MTKNKIISLDEKLLKDQLGELVRGSVEDTLNTLLDAEADRMCGAGKYERSENRLDTRAGSYNRKLHTKAGEVNLKVPKLRKMTFETAIIERYKRRESSIEESLIEMYMAGVSVRRVEDITEALWGTKVSPGTISNLNKKVYAQIEEWRNSPITRKYPYVYLDGTILKRTWGHEVYNVSILVAIGVDEFGFREVIGSFEGPKEDKRGWSDFLLHLKERGLKDVDLFVTDRCNGLVDSIEEHFPDSFWQRCTVHFYRNVFSQVPRTKGREVALLLKAIHAQESSESAKEKAEQVVEKLKKMRYPKAASIIENGIHETLRYYNFPEEHWRRIRTNNPLERIMKEIKRRTKVVGSFPDGQSALMLASARLRHISASKWSQKKYLNMNLLHEMKMVNQSA